MVAADQFPRPAAIEPQVQFWRDVFAAYSRWHVVVHDTEFLDRIYSVVDLTKAVERGASPIELERLLAAETEAERERVRSVLLRLHEGWVPDGGAPYERRIYDLVKDEPNENRFLYAADPTRLRTQRGIRERFAKGIAVSRRYLPEMEQIFREEGLPVELTRLPLVESCFNLEAYSKVGAAGIWQFMPATGRRFMQVGTLVDERRDPLASTRAAARFLRDMYEDLGAWPLAITAYNHGPYGIARAVQATGTTDIAEIIHRYRGRSFGFASRNFYPEFLAALDVEKNHEAYFGPLPMETPEATDVHELDHPVGVDLAASLAGIDRAALVALNPALMSPVVSGQHSIPRGYGLRLPADRVPRFADRIAELVAEREVMRVASPPAPVRRSAKSSRLASGKSRSGSARATKARSTTSSRAKESPRKRTTARSSTKSAVKRSASKSASSRAATKRPPSRAKAAARRAGTRSRASGTSTRKRSGVAVGQAGRPGGSS